MDISRAADSSESLSNRTTFIYDSPSPAASMKVSRVTALCTVHTSATAHVTTALLDGKNWTEAAVSPRLVHTTKVPLIVVLCTRKQGSTGNIRQGS